MPWSPELFSAPVLERIRSRAITDDGRSCALESNLVQCGRTDLPPAAAVAVHVRGATGRLAGVRIYNDVDPPVGPER